MPIRGVYVARVLTFVDTEGVEIHTISDPEDKLPIPEATSRLHRSESDAGAICDNPAHRSFTQRL